MTHTGFEFIDTSKFTEHNQPDPRQRAAMVGHLHRHHLHRWGTPAAGICIDEQLPARLRPSGAPTSRTIMEMGRLPLVYRLDSSDNFRRKFAEAGEPLLGYFSA